MEPTAQSNTASRLIFGEFAPVFWEPLGSRGERLVVGVIFCDSTGITKAHPTLEHKRLLEFISEGKTDSAMGVLAFAFKHFNSTLDAGGKIEDLKPPFDRMTIGRAEAVSGRNDNELFARAMRLCTLLGTMPEQHHRPDPGAAVARTLSFIREVRSLVRHSNKHLATEGMKTKQFYPIGNSQIRLHFHLGRSFAQFCSLPLPNARPETATECQARLNDLVMIKKQDPAAKIALCLNIQAVQIAMDHQKKNNATWFVLQRTKDFAALMDIPVKELSAPNQAVEILEALAD
jgi:hypothetical protein